MENKKRICKRSLAVFMAVIMAFSCMSLIASPIAFAATTTISPNGAGVVQGGGDRWSGSGNTGKINICNDGKVGNTSAGVIRYPINGINADAITNVKLSIQGDSNNTDGINVNFYGTTSSNCAEFVGYGKYTRSGWGGGTVAINGYLSALGVNKTAGYLGSINQNSVATRRELDITRQFKAAVRSGATAYYVVFMLASQDGTVDQKPWSDTWFTVSNQYITYDTNTDTTSNSALKAEIDTAIGSFPYTTDVDSVWFQDELNGNIGSDNPANLSIASNLLFSGKNKDTNRKQTDNQCTVAELHMPQYTVALYDGTLSNVLIPVAFTWRKVSGASSKTRNIAGVYPCTSSKTNNHYNDSNVFGLVNYWHGHRGDLSWTGAWYYGKNNGSYIDSYTLGVGDNANNKLFNYSRATMEADTSKSHFSNSESGTGSSSWHTNANLLTLKSAPTPGKNMISFAAYSGNNSISDEHDYNDIAEIWFVDYSSIKGIAADVKNTYNYVKTHESEYCADYLPSYYAAVKAIVTVDPTAYNYSSYDTSTLTTYVTAANNAISSAYSTYGTLAKNGPTKHIQGDAAQENVIYSTCTEDGSYNEVVRCTNCSVILSSTPKTIDAKGHTYGDPIGAWDWTGYTSAKAHFKCSVCQNPVDAITTQITNNGAKATCENGANKIYTATLNVAWGAFQDTKTETLSALGHDWTEVSYTWSGDNTDLELASPGSIKCTATRTCQRTGCGKVDTETVFADNNYDPNNTTSSCTEKGDVEYCAEFTNSDVFAAQYKTITNAPLAAHQPNHNAYKAATCTENGNIEYWNCTNCSKLFSDAACTNEITQDDTVLSATGHSATSVPANDATCTTEGNIAHWHCSKCNKNFEEEACINEIADVTIPAAHDWKTTWTQFTQDGVDKHGHKCTKCDEYRDVANCSGGEANCTEKAICSVCGKAYGATNNDHDWKVSGYAFSDDKLSCTATLVCSRSSEHTETVTTNSISSNIPNPATCTEKGTHKYTATFTDPRCEDYTQEFEDIEALGHDFTMQADKSNVRNVSAGTHNFACNNPGCSAQGTGTGATALVNGVVNCSGGEANCTEKAKCAVCGGAYGETLLGTHVWGEAFVQIPDTNTHAKQCTKCNAFDEDNAVACASTTPAPDCQNKATCDTCHAEFGDVGAHTPGEAVQENVIAATCYAEGSYDEVVYCSVEACKAEMSREAKTLEKVAHTFTTYVSNGDATCAADGTKTATCDVCGIATDTKTDVGSKDSVDHTYTTYVSNNDATCKEDGTETATCDVCGEATDIRIVVGSHLTSTNHVGGTTIKDAVTANCTTPGYTGDTYCVGCDKKIASGSETAIDSTNHTPYGVDTIHEIPATCCHTGNTEAKYCKGCLQPIDLGTEIPVDPDNHEDVVEDAAAVPATCSSTGLTAGSHCTACGNVVVAQTETPIDSNNHVNTVTTPGRPATCMSEGYADKIYCNDCHKTVSYGAPIPADPNNHPANKLMSIPGKEPTCTNPGYTAHKKCADCNKEIDKEMLPIVPTNHVMVYERQFSGGIADGTVIWGAYTCSECGGLYYKVTVKVVDSDNNTKQGAKVTISSASGTSEGTTGRDGTYTPDRYFADGEEFTIAVVLNYANAAPDVINGTVKIVNGTGHGALGILGPREPVGGFRCSMCSSYEKNKNKPVVGWIYTVVHFIVHFLTELFAR